MNKDFQNKVVYRKYMRSLKKDVLFLMEPADVHWRNERNFRYGTQYKFVANVVKTKGNLIFCTDGKVYEVQSDMSLKLKGYWNEKEQSAFYEDAEGVFHLCGRVEPNFNGDNIVTVQLPSRSVFSNWGVTYNKVSKIMVAALYDNSRNILDTYRLDIHFLELPAVISENLLESIAITFVQGVKQGISKEVQKVKNLLGEICGKLNKG